MMHALIIEQQKKMMTETSVAVIDADNNTHHIKSLIDTFYQYWPQKYLAGPNFRDFNHVESSNLQEKRTVTDVCWFNKPEPHFG